MTSRRAARRAGSITLLAGEENLITALINTGVSASAPEPATLALFGLGLGRIGAVRRRKLAA